MPDDEVLALAVRERRIVITNDKGFGELVFKDERPHAGIILFRLPIGHTQQKLKSIDRLLGTHADRLDRFLVVDRRGVRVR